MGMDTPDARRDLFLSYRRLDAERVAPLVTALNARGVTVWQDANEIDDLASIQRAIDDGLAHARALLVWYSKDYNASRACQWELTTAYCAAQASAAVIRGGGCWWSIRRRRRGTSCCPNCSTSCI